jgi:hypothetical protein
MVAWSLAVRRSKINSLNPPLTSVRTAYPAEPLLTVFHPPIELASPRPRGRLHLDRRIDFSAVCCGQVLQLVVADIHIRLEHAYDSDGREPRRRD